MSQRTGRSIRYHAMQRTHSSAGWFSTLEAFIGPKALSSLVNVLSLILCSDSNLI